MIDTARKEKLYLDTSVPSAYFDERSPERKQATESFWKKLANAYIDAEIFPERFKDDGRHVAVATVNEVNYLVSWNFKHLVNVKTRKMVSLQNLIKGYRALEIVAPPEL